MQVVNVFSDVKMLLQESLCDNECSVEVTVLAIEDDGRILVNIVTRYIESTMGYIWYGHHIKFDGSGYCRMTEKLTNTGRARLIRTRLIRSST